MNFKRVLPDKSISLFVKEIWLYEQTTISQTVLPFFADGYPGLIFQQADRGLFITPHNKQMPKLFLYGQTITPVELVLQGSYKLIVFQLYPFVLRSFFNIIPKDLNDNCYNLDQLPENVGVELINNLNNTNNTQKKVSILSGFLCTLFDRKKEELDQHIATAIKKIIRKNGQVPIQQLYTGLYLTERTFERRFINAVGVTAKQFCKMIQFQESLEQLTQNDYTKLTDIVYANGFADQSHFIKVFKAYTGKTPSAFKAQQ